MKYEYNPKIKLLLQENSEEKVVMTYIENRWVMPKVTDRPPYYKNPVYELHYPVL